MTNTETYSETFNPFTCPLLMKIFFCLETGTFDYILTFMWYNLPKNLLLQNARLFLQQQISPIEYSSVFQIVCADNLAFGHKKGANCNEEVILYDFQQYKRQPQRRHWNCWT